jgi:hypothetical protein
MPEQVAEKNRIVDQVSDALSAITLPAKSLFACSNLFRKPGGEAELLS